MNKKIILFSRDPGGANVVAPLYKKLIDKGYNVKLFGKDVALNKYSQYGLEGIDITITINALDIDEIEKFLSKESPDFLITGTSADDFTEKYIWKASEKLGIKSFAILDQWINYGVRFSRFSVNELIEYEKNRQHPYLPYKILVMDEYAKEQIIKEGIKENRVLISGQPYFDYLINEKRNMNTQIIKELRKNIGCNDYDFLITYASEPISKTYNENDKSEHYWGYSERTVFKEFISVLNQVLQKSDKKIKLILRLHPKEDENNYNDLIDLVNTKNISLLVDRKLDGLTLMYASDLICGMSSMFLIESAVLRKPILSMQIGLKRDNPFILDKKGVIKSILSRGELEEKIEKIILKNEIEECTYEVKEGAIENIINLMEGILCQY